MTKGEIIQMKEGLFLETSAQICRLSGVRKSEERVAKILKDYFSNPSESNLGCQLITSTVVYTEFLSTRIKDILLIRDMVKEEYLDKDRFELRLHEIDESLTVYPKIRGNRAQRAFAVTAALKKKFGGYKKIETKRLVLFLDTIARDIAFRDFFEIRIEGKKVKIEQDGPCYLKEIGCLTKDPLQEDCNVNNNYKCRYNLDFSNAHKNGHGDKCLVTDSPITQCQEDPKKYCFIEKFFNRRRVKENLELLKTAAGEGKFSSAFRNKSKNKKWLEYLQEVDFTKNDFAIRGQNCWRYFFDMLIFLQCLEYKGILSKDPDFGELGKAIGRNDIWVSF